MLYLVIKKSIMEELLLEYQQKLISVPVYFKRYLLDKVNLQDRLILVKGARGSGKTTLLLQIAKILLRDRKSLYVSLDHIYFYNHKLYDLAKDFSLIGGTHLLLDEVHKYPNWSREIKLIYDNFPELKLIITSSSLLEIYKSESDLSRRAISYYLKELSFREFIALDVKIEFNSYSLKDLIQNHVGITTDILGKIKPYSIFHKYLQIGAYPYFKENESNYLQKLHQTINLIIETDISAVEDLNYETLVKLKKLLITIATSAPFTPNITKLSQYVGVSRNTLIHAIKILHRAGLVTEVFKKRRGIGSLTKPEKLFLNNTNLMYALGKEQTSIGDVRETFFLNQLLHLYDIHLAEKGDFKVDDQFVFEVGGRNKTQKQIAGLKNAYLVKDRVEIGYGNTIPIWLFGFLY